MTVQQCSDCGANIEWLKTKFGRPLPFNYGPTPISPELYSVAWVPINCTVRGKRQIAMAPFGHIGDELRQRTRKVVVVHNCPEYQARIAKTKEVNA